MIQNFKEWKMFVTGVALTKLNLSVVHILALILTTWFMNVKNVTSIAGFIFGGLNAIK